MTKSISLRLAGVALIAFGLAACDSSGRPSKDAQRAGVGAIGGAVLSKAVGGDAWTGAALGAGAGALCDDAGVCRR